MPGLKYDCSTRLRVYEFFLFCSAFNGDEKFTFHVGDSVLQINKLKRDQWQQRRCNAYGIIILYIHYCDDLIIEIIILYLTADRTTSIIL